MTNNINMTEIFTDIYINSKWGTNNNNNYNGSSGVGSSVEYNVDYVPFLKSFIKSNDYNMIVDIGCGDFVIGDSIYNDLSVIYFGYDVYETLVNYNSNYYLDQGKYNYNFKILDCYNNPQCIQRGDLCIIKDVFEHWSNECIVAFLDNIILKKMFKSILICNCANRAVGENDINVGEFRELSANHYPLNKYNPIVVFTYNSKEVCVINIM